MTGLEAVLAVAGFAVTVLVIAGMILITPRGEVDLRGEATDTQGGPEPGRDGRACAGGMGRQRVAAV